MDSDLDPSPTANAKAPIIGVRGHVSCEGSELSRCGDGYQVDCRWPDKPPDNLFVFQLRIVPTAGIVGKSCFGNARIRQKNGDPGIISGAWTWLIYQNYYSLAVGFV